MNDEEKVKEIFSGGKGFQSEYEVRVSGGHYTSSGKKGVSVLIRHPSSAVVVYREQLDKLIKLFRNAGYEFVGIFCDGQEMSIDFVEGGK